MELDAPLSPRGRGCSPGGEPDHSLVEVAEREEVGRYLRLTRPVRRGEAILVEDALFLSPGGDEELEELLLQTLDPEAVAVARAEAAGASWPPASEQLSLVVVCALLEDGESPGCEEFRQLRGNTERWAGPAGRLWDRLRPELRAQVAREAMSEVYSIVASNAHDSEGGRAGIFRFGSYAEHSCAPTAFKEVVAPVEDASRPGSPCVPTSLPELDVEGSPRRTPPQTPVKSRGARQPQLVVRALQDMAEGDTVSLSYIPEYLPTWRRRELLQAGYDFACQCDRCSRAPELVCAFLCPRCGEGPCSPTVPVTVPAGLQGLSLRCESCDAMVEDEQFVQQLVQAELAEVVSADSMRLLHPSHHKIFGMYLHNMQVLPAADRAQAAEQLARAQRRMSGRSNHPLLGRLSELEAGAQLELGDHHQAVATLLRAQELFSASHRGPPEAGHALRCYRLQTRVEAGPLGAKPRRLSKLPVRSPSLPSLAENDGEEASP